MSEITPSSVPPLGSEAGRLASARVLRDAVGGRAQRPIASTHGDRAGGRARAGGIPPELSARAATHAAAAETLRAREATLRGRLAGMDRVLEQLSAQGTDLSARVGVLLAPGSAL